MSAEPLGLTGEMTITLPVRDISRAAKWYESNLGFQLLFHVKEAGWGELATRTAGATLGLKEEDKPKPIDGPTIAVRNVSQARKRLEQQGVKFDGDTMEIPGLVKLATFRDSDGNGLTLAESLAPPPGG